MAFRTRTGLNFFTLTFCAGSATVYLILCANYSLQVNFQSTAAHMNSICLSSPLNPTHCRDTLNDEVSSTENDNHPPPCAFIFLLRQFAIIQIFVKGVWKCGLVFLFLKWTRCFWTEGNTQWRSLQAIMGRCVCTMFMWE